MASMPSSVLSTLKRAADRLHGAARAEEKQRIRLRLDLLAQMRGDVVLDGVLVGAGDDGLGRLHIGRLERRARGHVEPHGPFVAAVPLLVEVDDLDGGEPDLAGEIAQQDFAPCGPA